MISEFDILKKYYGRGKGPPFGIIISCIIVIIILCSNKYISIYQENISHISELNIQ